MARVLESKLILSLVDRVTHRMRKGGHVGRTDVLRLRFEVGLLRRERVGRGCGEVRHRRCDAGAHHRGGGAADARGRGRDDPLGGGAQLRPGGVGFRRCRHRRRRHRRHRRPARPRLVVPAVRRSDRAHGAAADIAAQGGQPRVAAALGTAWTGRPRIHRFRAKRSRYRRRLRASRDGAWTRPATRRSPPSWAR